jgi:seryl-tRNA(Sec) selenium transferase
VDRYLYRAMSAIAPTRPQADATALGSRRLPAVERLVGGVPAPVVAAYGRTALTEAVRAELADLRARGGAVPDEAAIRAAAVARLAAERRPSLRPVFNLTGTVLHTNLGRALLPRSAAEAVLREVGTTNRTHLRDFAEAIGPRTGLVMKVHPSNYAISGFTAAADPDALHALCRERSVPLADDLGSGSLVDLAAYGLPAEPTVRSALKRADVVTFSGDKLLGAVQCGIVAGRTDLIARIRKNPLKRALRVDKMTYAALEAVLRLYLHPERLAEELPTLRLLTRDRAAIAEQARGLAPAVAEKLAGRATVSVAECISQIGSGALPVETLPSTALVLTPDPAGGDARRGAGGRCKRLAECLRALPVPVIGRISGDAIVLDLRTLEDEAALLDSLAALPPPRRAGADRG